MHEILLNYFDLIGEKEKSNEDLDLKKKQIDCVAEIIANVLTKECDEKK